MKRTYSKKGRFFVTEEGPSAAAAAAAAAGDGPGLLPQDATKGAPGRQDSKKPSPKAAKALSSIPEAAGKAHKKGRFKVWTCCVPCGAGPAAVKSFSDDLEVELLNHREASSDGKEACWPAEGSKLLAAGPWEPLFPDEPPLLNCTPIIKAAAPADCAPLCDQGIQQQQQQQQSYHHHSHHHQQQQHQPALDAISNSSWDSASSFASSFTSGGGVCYDASRAGLALGVPLRGPVANPAAAATTSSCMLGTGPALAAAAGAAAASPIQVPAAAGPAQAYFGSPCSQQALGGSASSTPRAAAGAAAELARGPVVRSYKRGRFAVEEALLRCPVATVSRAASCPWPSNNTNGALSPPAAASAGGAPSHLMARDPGPPTAAAVAAAMAAAAAAAPAVPVAVPSSPLALPAGVVASAPTSPDRSSWGLADDDGDTIGDLPPCRRNTTVSYFRRGRFLVQTQVVA